jgi:hypothetical protein
MSKNIIQELLRVYSHLPLGLLLFKNKKLFFINQHLREVIVLGTIDNENAVKIICSTLGIESNEKELYTFLSEKKFFQYKQKYIQISSKKVSEFDIFVFTRIDENLLEHLNKTPEVDFIPIKINDVLSNLQSPKEHLKLLEYFDKKRNSSITTHAIYKGLPLISKSRILRAHDNALVIKLEDKQLIAAVKDTPWMLKASLDINIKGTVVHFDKEKKYLFLKNLHRVKQDYNERLSIRYQPEEAVNATLSIESHIFSLALIDINEHAFKVVTDNKVIVDEIENYSGVIQTQIVLDKKTIHLKSKAVMKARVFNGKASIILDYTSDKENLLLLQEWRNNRQLEIIKEVHSFSQSLG